MGTKITKDTEKGFTLFYTVLMISIIMITSGIFVDTVLREGRLARDEKESLKAFYAADTAIECVRFLQANYQAFDTKPHDRLYSCGLGDAFDTSVNNTGPSCIEHTYELDIKGFLNGACASVIVQTIPRTINAGGQPMTICDTLIISNGKNTCTPGERVVERSRWETM
jgi:Tfp pilus assembly protein PilX